MMHGTVPMLNIPQVAVVCGCLTQVRAGLNEAQTKELTKAIRNSRSLPNNGHDIKVKHLPLFAKWQRRIDKELKRS